MAGNYMNAPGQRLAYDRDGSVVVHWAVGSAPSYVTSTNVMYLNDERGTSSYVSLSSSFAVIFPYLVNLRAIMFSYSGNVSAPASRSFYASQNSTSGQDGTWALVSSTVPQVASIQPDYRVAGSLMYAPQDSTMTNVRAIRSTGGSTTAYALHIYADPVLSSLGHAVVLWDPVLDAPLSATAFDWGDTPRSSTANRQFRVKNVSATKTATNVLLYAEAKYDPTPSVAAMHMLSLDGVTYSLSQLIPSIAPGTISGVVELRRTIPDNALFSTWSARVAAEVGTWV